MESVRCSGCAGRELGLPASADAGILLEIGSVYAAPGSSGNPIEVDLLNTGSLEYRHRRIQLRDHGQFGHRFHRSGFLNVGALRVHWRFRDQAYSVPLYITAGSSLLAGDISYSGDGETLGAGLTMGLALVTFDVSPTAALGPVTVFILHRLRGNRPFRSRWRWYPDR